MMAAVNARAAVAVVGCALAGCAASPPVLPAERAADLLLQVELDGTPFFRQSATSAALPRWTRSRGFRRRGHRGRTGARGVPAGARLAAACSRNWSQPPAAVAVSPMCCRPRTSALLAAVAGGEPVLVLQKLGAGPWPGWHYAVLVDDAPRDLVLLRSGLEPRKETSASHFLASWHRGGGWALANAATGVSPAGGSQGHDGGCRPGGRRSAARRCSSL